MNKRSEAHSEIKDEPKPSRKKHGTLKALKEATEAFAHEHIRWRFGDVATLSVEVDYRLRIESYERQRPIEDKARKIYYAMINAADAAWALAEESGVAKDENGRHHLTGPTHKGQCGGDYLRTIFDMSQAIRAARPNVSPGWGSRPSRVSWFVEKAVPMLVRHYGPEFRRPTDQALASLSIFSGFWPEAIDEERAPRGVSVAEAMREERKRIAQAYKRAPIRLYPSESNTLVVSVEWKPGWRGKSDALRRGKATVTLASVPRHEK